MSIISRLFSGVRRLANRDQAERDLQDEVDQYLRESIAAKRRAGMSYEAAERAARVELGSASAATEPARSWGWDASLEAFLSDVRYAARTLGKAPGCGNSASRSARTSWDWTCGSMDSRFASSASRRRSSAASSPASSATSTSR